MGADRVTLIDTRYDEPDWSVEVHDWSPGSEAWAVDTIGPVGDRDYLGNLSAHSGRGGVAFSWIDGFGEDKAFVVAYRRPDSPTFEPISAAPGITWGFSGIDGAGVISVVGVLDVGEPNEVLLARRDPVDGSWSQLVVIDDTPELEQLDIDVDESGFAMIDYIAEDDGQPMIQYVSCAPDGTCGSPRSFAVRRLLSDSAFAAGPDGAAVVGWTEYKSGCEECEVRELWTRYRLPR